MNDLVRPAMYDAWHGIVPVSAVGRRRPGRPATVVGPVCESGDTFARSRLLPPLAPNARVAILDAGAYGAVMSSTYNARPLAAEVWVDGDRWSVIRDRQPIEALWERRAAAGMNDPRLAAAAAGRPPVSGARRHPVRGAVAGAVARRSPSSGFSCVPRC